MRRSSAEILLSAKQQFSAPSPVVSPPGAKHNLSRTGSHELEVLRTGIVASSNRPSKRPSRSPATPRPRRKGPSGQAVAVEADLAPKPATEPTAPADGKNVGSLEGAFSLTLGFLLVIAALFPRSIRQLLMLGIGGGLAYRGLTRECGVYKTLGIDTTRE